MFWTYDHETILYTAFDCIVNSSIAAFGRQEVLLVRQEAKEYPSFPLGNRLYTALHSAGS